MSTKWRLLIDNPAPGAWNMAVDEALLANAGLGAAPVLRLYAWRPAALSLGCFQDPAVVDFNACRQKGIDVVRRPTGGRAVLHEEDEVTYAIVLPMNHPLATQGVIASYRALSAGLTRGLTRLSLQASLATPERPLKPERSSAHAACFDAPSWHELTVDGRKLVGSAQVRKGGALLQHGSIPMRLHADALYQLFRFDSEESRVEAARKLSDKAMGLNEVAGRAFAWREVADALVSGVQEALGCRLEPSSLTPAEQASAHELAGKHADVSWVMRKHKGEPFDG